MYWFYRKTFHNCLDNTFEGPCLPFEWHFSSFGTDLQVFPLAHVCKDTNKMTFINPQGVKLNLYKQKVEQAIKSYEKWVFVSTAFRGYGFCLFSILA